MPGTPGPREGLDPAGSTKAGVCGDSAPWGSWNTWPSRLESQSPPLGLAAPAFSGHGENEPVIQRYRCRCLSPAEGSLCSQGNGLAAEPPLLR